MRGTGAALQPTALVYSTALVMAVAYAFGGGASNGHLSNALVELTALPALILAILALIEAGAPSGARLVLFLIAGAVIIVTLQLVPLPPSVWSTLPFHEKAAIARASVGGASTWAPLSLDPEATIISLLTILPPLAVFLATLSLEASDRRMLVLLSLVFGFINGFVGLLQLSQGEDSVFYLYGGEQGVTVGLFANRNHEAAFLFSLIPFAAAWIGGVVGQSSKKARRRRDETQKVMKLLPPITAIIVFVAALLMAQSRAGVILLLFALASGLALQPFGGFRGGESRAFGLFGVVTLLALVLGLYYGLFRTLSRFEGDMFADARVKIADITSRAAAKAFPFGTGLGSFVPVYASFERPGDLYVDRFANQAHNDYLQIVLEAGAPGLGLMFAFLLWLVSRFRQIWSAPSDDDALGDVLMMRAATISISLLLAHSFVDYPLRTEALMVFFAFCCGLLLPPRKFEAAV